MVGFIKEPLSRTQLTLEDVGSDRLILPWRVLTKHFDFADMDVAPRRSRHADTKLYRPPKARPQNEQSRRVEQIVDYVEETLSLKDTPKPTARETRLIVEPQPKHRNKPKKDRRRKPSPKTQPASPTASPQGVESEHRDDATSVEVPIPEERDDGDVIKVELAQRIQGTDDDVSRVSEIIAGKTDCHIISKEGSGVGTYVELLKLMGPYFACKSITFSCDDDVYSFFHLL